VGGEHADLAVNSSHGSSRSGPSSLAYSSAGRPGAPAAARARRG
jgi:hypothetical protein